MKSTLSIVNKSDYYVPTINRSINDVLNPNLFQSAKAKREGYETRLYYEYLDTLEHGGFAQVITLTYNEKAIPKFYGFNCLNTQHIRGLFHDDSRFFKDIKKVNGYQFKYFVGAEFGEGGESHNYKGKRGKGNNPHYHIVLFFTPLKDWSYTDKETGEVITKPHLSPKEVCSAIIKYWCGNEVSLQTCSDFRLAPNYKFGACSFGNVHPLGVVQDFRGMSYVSKYCVKDAYFKQTEKELCNKLYWKFKKEAYEELGEDSLCIQAYIENKQKELIKEFRSNYSYRVMCSHSLGLSALNHIKDTMNPTVSIPTRKGNVERMLPLYLFRKLFYTHSTTKDGLVYYKLNELGKEYRMFHLDDVLKDSEDRTLDNLKALANNKELYINLLNSKDNHSTNPFISTTNYDKEVFINRAIELTKNLIANNTNGTDDLIKRYTLYNKIYKNRYGKYEKNHTDIFNESTDIVLSYPTLNYRNDFKYSLKDTHKPMYHKSVYDNSIYKEGIYPFFAHPHFSKDISLFDWLDNINSFMYVQKDRQNRKKYEDWKRLKDMQNRIKFAS